jgi:hypothetical protein
LGGEAVGVEVGLRPAVRGCKWASGAAGRVCVGGCGCQVGGRMSKYIIPFMSPVVLSLAHLVRQNLESLRPHLARYLGTGTGERGGVSWLVGGWVG